MLIYVARRVNDKQVETVECVQVEMENEQMVWEGQQADEPDESHGFTGHCCIPTTHLVADHRSMHKKLY